MNLKNWNFEGTFRRLLGAFENKVREDQDVSEKYTTVLAEEVDAKREKVILMFRHHDMLVKKLRDVLQKIETETMDPPIQELARKALKLK